MASAGLTRERSLRGLGGNDCAGEIDVREERERATALARSARERRGHKIYHVYYFTGLC